MRKRDIAIHIVLLITLGLGNIIYAGWRRNWSKKKIALGIVAWLVIFIAIGATGDTSEPTEPEVDTAPESTDTDTPTDTETATQTETQAETENESNAIEQSAKRGLNAGGAWSDGVREIDATEKIGGDTLVSVRYNLDTDTFDGMTSEKAEKRAAFTAREVVMELQDEDVSEVAIYAYVPTNNGESVSTKIVIEMENVEGVDWASCAVDCMKTHSDQWKHNDYLYQ